MRILFVSPDAPFTRQAIRAFSAEGHEIKWINERSGASVPFLWAVLRNVRPLRKLRNALLGRRMVSAARKFNPDLLLVNKGTTVKEPTLRELRSMGVPLANWFPENGRREPYRSWLDRNVGLYDVFFCFDSELLNRQSEFPGTRLVWLPLGVGPEDFHAEISDGDREKYRCDVVFIGAYYPEREAVLKELSAWNLKVFGWKGWEKSSLADRYHGPLTAGESAKAYRCAKICINMNLEPPVAGVNAKTFEICAAGGFQITDFRADLPRLYTEDREIVVFRTVNELKEKISRYLGDEGARGSIAQAGHERTIRDHTMQNRVRTIVNTV